MLVGQDVALGRDEDARTRAAAHPIPWAKEGVGSEQLFPGVALHGQGVDAHHGRARLLRGVRDGVVAGYRRRRGDRLCRGDGCRGRGHLVLCVPARWRKETAQVEGGEDGQQRQRADRERSVHSCLRLGSAAGRSTSDAAVWA